MAHLAAPDDAVLRVEELTVEYRSRRSAVVHAVSSVSFDVLRGETLAIVGESGCGKSTIARAAIGMSPPTSGRVYLEQADLTKLSSREFRQRRAEMQLIYQDPTSSLNPRLRIGHTVGEPLVVWKRGSAAERRRIVDEMLDAVGLDPETTRDRRPNEFSGGQCQRISIARALVLNPKLLICDEPVSALDVSVQAQILNLLADIKERRKLTMVFISHDLGVVKNVSDRVLVMYLGKLCEVADTETLFSSPAHPYTQGLLDAVPTIDIGRPKKDLLLSDEPASATAPPSGCRFRTRCPRASELCASEEPQVRAVGWRRQHFVACHHPLVELPTRNGAPVTIGAKA